MEGGGENHHNGKAENFARTSETALLELRGKYAQTVEMGSEMISVFTCLHFSFSFITEMLKRLT